MSEFFSMGGYAVYVWPSFALTAIVMLANLYAVLRKRKRLIAKLKLQQSIDNGNSGS